MASVAGSIAPQFYTILRSATNGYDDIRVRKDMDLNYLGKFDRIYAYARVSSEEQADKRKSLDGQISRLQQIQPSPDRLFRDVMGGDEAGRPDYLELKKAVRSDRLAGRTVMIVITELDRIARDAQETASLINEWDEIGAFLFALDGGRYSGVEPHDWLRASQEATYAEYFLRSLRRRLRQAKQQRREAGWPVVMNPPMGYLWTREKLLPDPEAWDKCRQLIDLALPPPAGAGLTLNMLAKKSVELGLPIKTPHGIRSWISNPILRGHLAPRDGGWSRKEQERKIEKPKLNQFKRHEALMTEGEWLLIDARLADNKKYARCPDNVPRYPLSGLIQCGYCGRGMTVQTVAKKYQNYECRNIECSHRRSVSARKIEATLIQALTERRSASFLAEQAQPLPVEQINPEIPKIRERIKSLEKIYEADPLPSIKKAIEELYDRLSMLMSSPDEPEEFSHDLRLEILSDPASYKLLSNEEKRLLYHGLVEVIACRGSESIEITLSF